MTRTKWMVSALLVGLVACGGGQKTDQGGPTPGGGATGGGEAGGEATAVGAASPLPAIPSAPAVEPDSLLAVASIGDPAGQLTQVAGFADAVQPGAGAMMSPAQILPNIFSLVRAPALEGIALDKPMYFLILDPKKGGNMILVFGVADEAKLKASFSGSSELMIHEGFAAVGSRESLQVGAAYALSNLAKSAPPAYLAGTLYNTRIMASYGDMVKAQMQQSMGASKTPAEVKAAEGVVDLLSQIDRIQGSLMVDATGLTMNGTVMPKAQTALATFAGAQKPSDFAFASKLGAGPWAVLWASSLDLSSFKTYFAELAAASGGAQAGDLLGVLGNQTAFGLGIKDGKPRLAMLMALADAKKASGLLETVIKGVTALPMKELAISIKANALKVSGGTMTEIGFAPAAGATADQKKEFGDKFGKGVKAYAGIVGPWLAAVYDQDAGKAAKDLATSVGSKKKGSLGKALDGQLAAAVEHKESALFVIDPSWFMIRKSDGAAPVAKPAENPGVAFGVGFDGGNVALRFALPIDTVKALAKHAM